jgi:hypothetical protein
MWPRLGSADADVDAMIGRVDVLDQAGVAPAVVNDFFWDVTPPATTIRYGWLSPPFRARADQPINDPAVTASGHGTAYAPNATSIARYGDYSLPVTLATAVDADADCLATWLSTYYADFRMRCPSLTVNLLNGQLTPTDVQTVLGIRIGDRITIPDAPATWPQGNNSLIVEGISRQVLVGQCRTVTFNTSPVIGSTPGAPGPWFRWGSSTWGGTDQIPF